MAIYKIDSFDLDTERRVPIKWTEDEHQKLVDELKQGLSFEEIAKRHGRTVNAIQIRLGWLANRAIQKGMSVEAALAEFKTTQEFIDKSNEYTKNKAPENNKSQSRWTDEEHQQLKDEVQSGLSFEEIAKKHSRTVNAIQIKLACLANQAVEEGMTVEDALLEFKTTKELMDKYKKDKKSTALPLDTIKNELYRLLLTDKKTLKELLVEFTELCRD